MNAESIDKALEGLRTGLRQDGADLMVDRVSSDCVELSLIFRNNTCLECIVGTEILLAKVRLVLSKALPQVPNVVLHDPRCSK